VNVTRNLVKRNVKRKNFLHGQNHLILAENHTVKESAIKSAKQYANNIRHKTPVGDIKRRNVIHGKMYHVEMVNYMEKSHVIKKFNITITVNTKN
jgi:hypothetical protein